MKAVLEAWVHDGQAVSDLAYRHWTNTSTSAVAHKPSQIVTYMGGKSPITKEDYGTNTYLVLYEG